MNGYTIFDHNEWITCCALVFVLQFKNTIFVMQFKNMQLENKSLNYLEIFPCIMQFKRICQGQTQPFWKVKHSPFIGVQVKIFTASWKVCQFLLLNWVIIYSIFNLLFICSLQFFDNKITESKRTVQAKCDSPQKKVI